MNKVGNEASSHSRKLTLLAFEKHQKGLFEIVAMESELANVGNIVTLSGNFEGPGQMSQNLW